MMLFILFFSIFTACFEDPMAERKAAYEAKKAKPQISTMVKKAKSKSLNEPVAEGSWGFSFPQIISDPCDVQSFNKGLAKNIPKKMKVSYSSKSSFSLSPEVKCNITGSSFKCSPMFREKEYMGAMIELSNTMYGTISDSRNLDLLFSVNILSCSGSTLFCGGMDAALDLPCTVELRATAQKK